MIIFQLNDHGDLAEASAKWPWSFKQDLAVKFEFKIDLIDFNKKQCFRIKFFLSFMIIFIISLMLNICLKIKIY